MQGKAQQAQPQMRREKFPCGSLILIQNPRNTNAKALALRHFFGLVD
jgi:hypothetical protein